MRLDRYGIKLWTAPASRGGALLLDLSEAAGLEAEFVAGEHGFETATIAWQCSSSLVNALKARLSNACLSIACRGALVWEGRVEDVTVTQIGPATWRIEVAALTYFRALADNVANDLASDTTYDRWALIETTELPARRPELFITDNDGRLLIGLKNGQGYDALRQCTWRYQCPSGNNEKIRHFAFNYAGSIPANWQLLIEACNVGFAGLTTIATLTSFSPPGAYSYNTPNHDWILVTFKDTRTAPTLTAPSAAGTGVTITVDSNAALVNGDRIEVSGASGMDQANVLSKIGFTQFTATMQYPHTSGNTVSWVRLEEDLRSYISLTDVRVAFQTPPITADKVAAALTTAMAAFGGQISGITGRIVAPAGAQDLRQYLYNGTPAAVLDQLRLLGGTTPQRIRVDRDQLVVLEDRYRSTTVYVRGAPQTNSSTDALVTRIKPGYDDPATGKHMIGATVINTLAEARYGIKRTIQVDYPATSAVEAAAWAMADLADRDTAQGWGEVETPEIYRARAIQSAHIVQPGDAMIYMESPIALPSGEVLNDRVVYVGERRITIDATGRSYPTLIPEGLPPRLAMLLAQIDTRPSVKQNREVS